MLRRLRIGVQRTGRALRCLYLRRGGGNLLQSRDATPVNHSEESDMKSLKLALGAFLAAGAAAVVAGPSLALAQYPGGYGQATGPNPQLIEARRQIDAAQKEVNK